MLEKNTNVREIPQPLENMHVARILGKCPGAGKRRKRDKGCGFQRKKHPHRQLSKDFTSG